MPAIFNSIFFVSPSKTISNYKRHIIYRNRKLYTINAVRSGSIHNEKNDIENSIKLTQSETIRVCFIENQMFSFLNNKHMPIIFPRKGT